MNLHTKIQMTEPGKHACAIGDVLYSHRNKIGEKDTNELTAARTYLESLALAELKTEVEPWVAELITKE